MEVYDVIRSGPGPRLMTRPYILIFSFESFLNIKKSKEKKRNKSEKNLFIIKREEEDCVSAVTEEEKKDGVPQCKQGASIRHLKVKFVFSSRKQKCREAVWFEAFFWIINKEQ